MYGGGGLLAEKCEFSMKKIQLKVSFPRRPIFRPLLDWVVPIQLVPRLLPGHFRTGPRLQGFVLLFSFTPFLHTALVVVCIFSYWVN